MLSAEKILEIKGTVDFFSLNYYTSRLVSELTDEQATSQNIEIPSWEHDMHLFESVAAQWKHSQLHWLYSVPEGIGDILRRVL